jgi:hypothetical protein
MSTLDPTDITIPVYCIGDDETVDAARSSPNAALPPALAKEVARAKLRRAGKWALMGVGFALLGAFFGSCGTASGRGSSLGGLVAVSCLIATVVLLAAAGRVMFRSVRRGHSPDELFNVFLDSVHSASTKSTLPTSIEVAYAQLCGPARDVPGAKTLAEFRAAWESHLTAVEHGVPGEQVIYTVREVDWEPAQGDSTVAIGTCVVEIDSSTAKGNQTVRYRPKYVAYSLVAVEDGQHWSIAGGVPGGVIGTRPYTAIPENYFADVRG